MDERTKTLLMKLQYEFPIVEKPFEKIANELNIDEATLINYVKKLQSEGIIRRIGSVLNYKSRKLEAALVCLKIPEEEMSELTKFLRNDPGISHIYVREHSRFNFWFVIKKRSIEEIKQFVNYLKNLFTIEIFDILPTLRTLRLDVKFNLYTGISEAKILKLPDEIPSIEELKLDLKLLKLIYRIEICPKPFKKIADECSISENKLLNLIRRLIKLGIIRDFYAVLNQERIDFRANAIIAIKTSNCSELVKFKEFTHIVERFSLNNIFTYNCFGVVHATSKDLIEDFVKSKLCKFSEIEVIYSVKNLLPEMPHLIEYS